MKLEKAKYIGYIWESDKTHPAVYYGVDEFEPKFDNNANPFVVEAQLWDAESRTSYSIKYVDGRHERRKYQVTPEALADKNMKKEYVPHRIDKVKKLVFLQYWNKEADPECEGFDVLVPGERVFVGFKMKED